MRITAERDDACLSVMQQSGIIRRHCKKIQTAKMTNEHFSIGSRYRARRKRGIRVRYRWPVSTQRPKDKDAAAAAAARNSRAHTCSDYCRCFRELLSVRGQNQRLPPACTDTFAPPMQSKLNWSSVDRRYLLSAALTRNNSRRRFVLHRDLHIACLKQIRTYCRKVIQRFT